MKESPMESCPASETACVRAAMLTVRPTLVARDQGIPDKPVRPGVSEDVAEDRVVEHFDSSDRSSALPLVSDGPEEDLHCRPTPHSPSFCQPSRIDAKELLVRRFDQKFAKLRN